MTYDLEGARRQAATTSSRGAGMDKKKIQRLRRAGWKVGSVAEFLDLTPEEAAYIELRLALSDALRARRTDSGLTQEDLARRLGSSQSRVAKMEGSDPSVSVDLLIRGLLATGASRDEIAAVIGRKEA
jgi:ribosome-binding protein aMBF1 (putative translation factor)